MEINNQTILKRNKEILSTEMDGETVMMSVENSEYYSLSPVGTKIWELLENDLSFEQLINLLMEEFDVDKQTCQNDTKEFLEELIDKGLIKVENK